MGFLESTVWKLFNSPQRDVFPPISPKLLETPLRSSTSKFLLPNGDSSSSSSSSSSSLSSASSFWQSPSPLQRWSPNRYIPSKYRSALSKSQIAVLISFLLALLVWTLPPPGAWRHQVVHISVPQVATNPYQVLRPISPTVKKHAPDPMRWLGHNSNNRHSLSSSPGLLSGKFHLGHPSPRPRAALISLVRNSELPGLMQSMRQLEFHWNHKYQYPWVFFNDEPFSEEFRVCPSPEIDAEQV